MGATLLDERRGGLVIKITGEEAATAGGIGEVANPAGQTLLITKSTLLIDVASTGVATLSTGVDASGGTFTDIISALAVNGAIAGKVYNGHARQNTAKTEITAPAKWHATDVIGFTGSADTTGLVAYLILETIGIPEAD